MAMSVGVAVAVMALPPRRGGEAERAGEAISDLDDLG
jgi:hypothetical protein